MAGLPDLAQKLTKKDFARFPSTVDFFAYVHSSAFAGEQSSGRGICLVGDPKLRSDLLILLAKAYALNGRVVHYTSLHSLAAALQYDHEKRSQIGRTHFLFVDWFEKDTQGQVSPYTEAQRADIEEFLTARAMAGRTTNFSACRSWAGLKWWSKDFLGYLGQTVSDLRV